MKQEQLDAWVKRAEQVMSGDRYGKSTELYQFAISFLSALYGPSSVQVKALTDSANAIQKMPAAYSAIQAHCQGVIQAAVDDVKAGLVMNVRAQIEGEVLGDLLALAKTALADKGDSGMQVAAVLTAAAFEDVLRRLAADKIGLTTRPKLEQVILELKNADVLRGGEISLANGYLKFRNDSLHADWSNVVRPQVEGCMSLVESLLLKHFS
jgi:hypothetical protein